MYERSDESCVELIKEKMKTESLWKKFHLNWKNVYFRLGKYFQLLGEQKEISILVVELIT